jgi:hypothetical protein
VVDAMTREVCVANCGGCSVFRAEGNDCRGDILDDRCEISTVPLGEGCLMHRNIDRYLRRAEGLDGD